MTRVNKDGSTHLLIGDGRRHNGVPEIVVTDSALPWSSRGPWETMAEPQMPDWTLPTVVAHGGAAQVDLNPLQEKNKVVPPW